MISREGAPSFSRLILPVHKRFDVYCYMKTPVAPSSYQLFFFYPHGTITSTPLLPPPNQTTVGSPLARSSSLPPFRAPIPYPTAVEQDLTLRQQHDQPCAPVKPSKRTRSILRRVSSVTQGGGDTFPLSVDNNTDARRTARRLTWNDKETNGTGSGGKLEHVRLYNKNDDMSTCSYVGPYRSTAAARRKSTGSHSNASSDSGSLNTSVARGSSLNSTFRSDGGGDVIIPSSTLDRTAQSAVQRIAMQLMKHEATNGDTSELSSMERCGKMLKRKVTAKVAALVEAVAASDTSSAAGAGASSSSSHAGDELRRPVTTAGDALLTYLVCTCCCFVTPHRQHCITDTCHPPRD